MHYCDVFVCILLNRQKSLEDSLLVAGQFKDALQLQLDWLYKVEPSLNEDQPVHGDADTVNSLIEQHKVRFVFWEPHLLCVSYAC